MKTIAAIALILCLATAAFGHLGETVEECEARYGPRLKTEGETTYFSKDGTQLAVHFYEAKADRIIYISVRSVALSEQSAELMLYASNGWKNWVDQKTIAAGRVWATEDGARWAFYNSGNRTLSIATRENVKRMEAAKKVEDAAQLRTF